MLGMDEFIPCKTIGVITYAFHDISYAILGKMYFV